MCKMRMTRAKCVKKKFTKRCIFQLAGHDILKGLGIDLIPRVPLIFSLRTANRCSGPASAGRHRGAAFHRLLTRKVPESQPSMGPIGSKGSPWGVPPEAA
jgi:hypothetical protein